MLPPCTVPMLSNFVAEAVNPIVSHQIPGAKRNRNKKSPSGRNFRPALGKTTSNVVEYGITTRSVQPMKKILRSPEGGPRWVCPKCGRSFRHVEQDHYCGAPPETIEAYIAAQPEDVQDCLRQVNAAIKASLPEAKEKISWSMPTYWKGPQSHSLCGLQAAHRPLPWPGGGGDLRRAAACLQDQQGRHSNPLQRPPPPGADCGDCGLVRSAPLTELP